MNISYPRGAADFPVVKLDQVEETELFSGKPLAFRIHLPSGPKEIIFYSDNEQRKPMKDDRRQILLSEFRINGLRANERQYFPLGMAEGFYLEPNERN